MHPAISSWIEQRIARAERSLTDQTGGANVCKLHHDGRVTGGMKYDEGQLVALNAVRRRIRAAGETGEDLDLGKLVAQDLAEWREALRVQQARERPSIQWVAYRQGGVDALEGLLEELDRVGAEGTPHP